MANESTGGCGTNSRRMSSSEMKEGPIAIGQIHKVLYVGLFVCPSIHPLHT
jgi:hypothetical protein